MSLFIVVLLAILVSFIHVFVGFEQAVITLLFVMLINLIEVNAQLRGK